MVRLDRLTMTTSSAPHPDAAGRRAAEEGQGQGERGEEERGGEHPAVPQALLDLLAGDDQDVPHGAAASERRKCA